MSGQEVQEVSLGAMLSLVQERMLAPGGLSEIYGLIYHVLIGPGHDRSIAVVIDYEMAQGCARELVRQHPWLAVIPARSKSDMHRASVYDWAWLDHQEQRWGPRHPVRTKATRSSE
jgi:hypothetical protein